MCFQQKRLFGHTRSCLHEHYTILWGSPYRISSTNFWQSAAFITCGSGTIAQCLCPDLLLITSVLRLSSIQKSSSSSHGNRRSPDGPLVPASFCEAFANVGDVRWACGPDLGAAPGVR